MDGEKRPAADQLNRFHIMLMDKLTGVRPDEPNVSLTPNEALGLLSEYWFRSGQVEGLSEGMELLRSIIEKR